MKKNNRGFAEYGEGVDTDGNTWRVVESSIAGDPHCWIFIERTGQESYGSLHLHFKQVEELISQIGKFPHPNPRSDGAHVYGSGTCRYKINWELRDTSVGQARLELKVGGVTPGGGTVEERRKEGYLLLSVEQVVALKQHLQDFLEHSMGSDHWKNSGRYRKMWREGDNDG
jgi:hypothetical protein